MYQLRQYTTRACTQQATQHTRTLTLQKSILSRRVQQMAEGRIDGKQLAQTIRKELKDEVEQMKTSLGQAPGLAVVLVGDRKDSQTYVRNKIKACDEVGIVSVSKTLGADTSEEELMQVVQSLNNDASIHGILVQLPLPSHINEQRVLESISLEKDVDGFHPDNIGRLGMRGREPAYVSCTPQGCMEILDRYNVEVKGKRAAVVGRSNIVGLPVALLLMNKDATVSIIHSRTVNPEQVCREADIVVAACGRAKMVNADWVKDGAVVIDVGINSVDDPSTTRGYRLVGDVDYEAVAPKASLITPVPGGVGPMTIAMLLKNTVKGAKRALGAQ